MDQQDRLYLLIARKLSGEATLEELAELARYQQEHPESTYSLQVLTDLWNQHSKDELKDGQKAEADSEAAFQRHLTRMALRDTMTPVPDPPKAVHRRRRRHISPDLIINYFKIARRSLYRNKGFSAINISGLAIGLASAIVLLLWIRNELTFDQFHKNRDRVYQALSRGLYDGQHIGIQGRTPQVTGPVLTANYPHEVETVVRMNWVGAFIFTAGDKHVQTQGYLCDPGF